MMGRPTNDRAVSRVRSASFPRSEVEYVECAEAELLEGIDAWSSRDILAVTWGSKGASGVLRGVDGVGLPEDTTRTGEIDGILVRRYDIGEDLLDVVDTLSGGRSRFDSRIEGRKAQRQSSQVVRQYETGL